jgi:hypothetical protein
MGATNVVHVGSRSENRTATGLEQPITTTYVDVDLSASYGPGGDTLDVSALLPERCFGAAVAARVVIADDDLRFAVVPGPSDAPNLMRVYAYVGSTGLPVADAVDLSGETIRLVLDGR